MTQRMLWFSLGMLGTQFAAADECDTLLDSVGTDWRAGKLAAVASKLQTQELQCAGKLRYNLLLGEALLAAGQPADALMPLERAVILSPEEQAGWRALLQAWLQLGDREAAQVARQALRGVLDVPDENGAGSGFHWRLSLEGERGHDSNTSQLTSETGVVVPALGDVRIQLSPLSRQKGDSYWANTLRTDEQWTLSPSTAVHLGVADTRRNYDNLHTFSTEEQNVTAGADHTGQYGDWSYGIENSRFLQAGDLVRQSLSGNLSWHPVHGSLLWPTFGLDVGAYRYKGGKQAPDGFVEKVLSVGNAFPLGRCTIGWSVLAGRDFATVRRADGDRDIVGMRLLATGPLARNIEWFGWFDRIDSHYQDTNPAFIVDRHEALNGLTGGLSWTVSRGLSLRGQISLSRQHSNIPLYDYRRADSSLSLRYEFGS